MTIITLTTRRDEICIGGNIRLSVGQAEGRRARIAIDAPRWVRVDRGEFVVRRDDSLDLRGTKP